MVGVLKVQIKFFSPHAYNALAISHTHTVSHIECPFVRSGGMAFGERGKGGRGEGGITRPESASEEGLCVHCAPTASTPDSGLAK